MSVTMSNGRFREEELPIAKQVRELSLETILWHHRKRSCWERWRVKDTLKFYEMLTPSLTHPTVRKVFGVSAFTSTADICCSVSDYE